MGRAGMEAIPRHSVKPEKAVLLPLLSSTLARDNLAPVQHVGRQQRVVRILVAVPRKQTRYAINCRFFTRTIADIQNEPFFPSSISTAKNGARIVVDKRSLWQRKALKGSRLRLLIRGVLAAFLVVVLFGPFKRGRRMASVLTRGSTTRQIKQKMRAAHDG